MSNLVYLSLDIVLVILSVFLGWYARGRWDDMFKHDSKYHEEGQEEGYKGYK